MVTIQTIHVNTLIYYIFLIQFRVAGGLEPILAAIGQEAGYSLDGLPVHHRDKTETSNIDDTKGKANKWLLIL